MELEMNIDIDISAIKNNALAKNGNVSGIYFLFDNDELVYIGQGWNCLLSVAEHTRKESDKVFTHWNYIEIQSEIERKNQQRELRKKYSPKFNKI